MVTRSNKKCLDTRTHIKRWSLKYSIIFLSISSLLLKKTFFYVCWTKHFLFGHVTILEFLMLTCYHT